MNIGTAKTKNIAGKKRIFMKIGNVDLKYVANIHTCCNF